MSSFFRAGSSGFDEGISGARSPFDAATPFALKGLAILRRALAGDFRVGSGDALEATVLKGACAGILDFVLAGLAGVAATRAFEDVIAAALATTVLAVFLGRAVFCFLTGAAARAGLRLVPFDSAAEVPRIIDTAFLAGFFDSLFLSRFIGDGGAASVRAVSIGNVPS